MSKILHKKRIKLEVKANIKAASIQAIVNRIPSIKERLLTNFSIVEDMAIAGESLIDLLVFKQVFIEKLDDFLFVPVDVEVFTLRIPNMDNFDFTGIEFLETIFEGVIGDYAEATYIDMLKLFGADNLPIPVNEGMSSEPIYLIPINEWLVEQELPVLGYSLNRFPFSNTEPLYDLVFGEVQRYVSNNFDDWISEAIKTSIADTVEGYGGK